MIIEFDIFAGNMWCGRLCVNPSGEHLFIDTLGRLELNTGTSERVQGFKRLKLVRI